MKLNRATFKLLQLIPKVINWIHFVFIDKADSRPWHEYQFLISKMSLVLKTRGPLGLITFCKQVRGALLCYLSGSRVTSLGVRCTKDGIPLALGPLIKSVRVGSPPVLQVINTILFSTRALNAGRLPDISPIINPPSVEPFDKMDKYTTDFWRSLGYKPSQKVPRWLSWKKFHFTTKAGPNGHALWTCLRDLASLNESTLESLRVIGGEKFTLKLNSMLKGLKLFSGILPTEVGKARRLSYFPDKEVKVRVIGILDYWSQTVLRPFHYYLFGVLRKIPQDCTFGQGNFKSKLERANEFYSIDLTAATDRFPIAFIEMVLKAKLPSHWVSHWRNLMVGTPFDYDGKMISYLVGNPMGAYSSWSSFAVAHHYLVYYCCRELGRDWKELPYVLLGDDIVIGDKEVAELYLSLIKSLGVEVSMSKTHQSSTLYEFAKRLVYKGQEITPFPISALAETSSRYYLLTNLLIETENKGWVSKIGIPSAVASYYGIVKGKPSKYRRKIHDLSLISELIIKVMRKVIPAGSALMQIAGSMNIQFNKDITDDVGYSILSNIAVEMFADSTAVLEDESGPPLGLLAENLVIYLTGLENEADAALGFELIYSLPHLGCYGQIEEMYMNLKKEAIRIDTVASGDWPLLLKAMTVPMSDQVFFIRSSHMVPKASAVIGKYLKAKFSELKKFWGY